MNLNKIPKALYRLLPMVEEWGISDDGERDSKIYHASSEQLKELVTSLSDKDDEELDIWLCGEEAKNPPFSDEYVAYTSFVMAYQYARQILIDRNELPDEEF